MKVSSSRSVLAVRVPLVQGGCELSLRARVSLSSPSAFRGDFGPVSLSFEIPMCNLSTVQVRINSARRLETCSSASAARRASSRVFPSAFFFILRLRCRCRFAQVRYLRVADPQASFSPFRWVRYMTHSSSYVCRFF